MLNHLTNHFNKTTTENGAPAFKSTNSAVLDLFAQGGAMRAKDDHEVTSMVSKAFAEDATLTLKALFYLRDIRGSGQGERRLFKVALVHLATHHTEALRKNLSFVPEFGRFDDLWVLLDTPLKKDVIALVRKQLESDLIGIPSLLGKWLASENASSTTTKRYGKMLREGLGLKPREYRKMLTKLRNEIGILETLLTEKKYSHIKYDRIPSQAGMKYRQAFFRNDMERYTAFLDSLSKGEVKVNAGTLYPSDIVGKILGEYSYYRMGGVSHQDVQLFEGQWNNLPDFIGDKKENSLVMADVSGSMMGTPMNVSVALAMYIAERNKGVYHNHFMTFSSRPELVKIQGGNIVEKVQNISQAEWGMSTNIELALSTILQVAVENNVPKEEMVKRLFIISDMQWNQAQRGVGVSVFNNMQDEFEDYGYDFPEITFWNVRATDNVPAHQNSLGVTMVSGYSPSILKQLLNAEGKTPYDFMLEVLLQERYEKITA